MRHILTLQDVVLQRADDNTLFVFGHIYPLLEPVIFDAHFPEFFPGAFFLFFGGFRKMAFRFALRIFPADVGFVVAVLVDKAIDDEFVFALDSLFELLPVLPKGAPGIDALHVQESPAGDPREHPLSAAVLPGSDTCTTFRELRIVERPKCEAVPRGRVDGFLLRLLEFSISHMVLP